MSSTADTGPATVHAAFNPSAIAALIIAGVLGFVAFWALSAFAPELGQGRDGGAHALSRSAISYSAVVELLRADGLSVEIDRSPDSESGLLVLTPPPTASAADLAERIEAHGDQPVLIVLPRWQTRPHAERSGWVYRGDSLGESAARWLAAEPFRLNLSFREEGGFAGSAHDRVLAVQASGITPVVAGAQGGAVIGRIDAMPQVLLLADPDLIANHGVATPARAAAAVALIRSVAPGNDVHFDVILNGFGSGRSLLRLAFTPPFLGLTLCLLAAGLLALLAGFLRFGPPLRDVRAVAFGKAALVANSARLIVQAQRVQHFAAMYADQVRSSVARRMHAPAALTGADLDAWLDRFGDGPDRFSTLAAALARASTSFEAVARARALGQWRKDILRGHH